ncbi:haloacid dehalogenase superfamily, subfamily IA, variant 3 with third motif having DD or ED [Solimonas aquatica]|uniref:Haloacid dehalogenase superfamily, subfamily IA, variant 3 with third motif having DD or ED n=1 Tax=Solimonas aquatica TaxID=489703 RepID=A0A1H9DHH9_9GAMM|nr:HAD-IA family hydrolase [Solimonas aquatica]SEQ12757.1 haloacid dehalogenase superfamily, subfamily IA, variant 3 with third motif having DD or ED [Solimonas aquatica]
MLQALIFDVDGTLAESEEAHRAAFNAAFAEAGLDWYWDRELYAQLLKVTGGKERIRHYLQQAPRRLGGGGEDWIARLHQRKNALYAAAVRGGAVPLRSGVRRLISEARHAGLQLAIATTTSEANVRELLEAAELAGHFDCIVAGDAVRAKKPAPHVYLETLRRLQLPARDCLALEDSELGLRAASAAGIATVVTLSVYTLQQDFSGALAVLDQLGEPQQPFRLREGPQADGVSHVNLDLLRRWHQQASLRAEAGAVL